MRRGEFVGILIGTSVAWPLIVGAQEHDRVWRIGALMAVAEHDPMAQPWVTALEERLEKLGWQIGRNLRIDYRWSSGNLERMPTLAAELVSLNPDLLPGR
jgi:putative ABC transport system substrate-binding protein